jgi:predicted dehydrogenase
MSNAVFSRRSFVLSSIASCAAMSMGDANGEVIQGFDERDAGSHSGRKWQPFSDRKVRVGIAGEGVCSFGSAFAYQYHPNVEVVSCTDLDPEKRRILCERVKAKKTYPSCEELIRHAAEDRLEALYIATDAPSHARLAVMALEHDLHVVSACPAVFGEKQLELVPRLVEAARKSGKIYAMNETTAFRSQCYSMRKIFEAGGFGKHVYTEGEYFHYWGTKGIASFGDWRNGLPPQYYPTHSNGYYTCTTHGSFTEVSCIGIRSDLPDFKNGQNPYGNPFGSEVAFFKTSDGGAARMAVMWDAPGYHGETGRFHGTKGSFTDGPHLFDKAMEKSPDIMKFEFPAGIDLGGHGGSHAYLTDDFIRAILVDGHKPCVDLKTALDTTVSGIYAHMSAMKDSETLKIPAVM